MIQLATKFVPEPMAFEAAYRAGFRFAEFWTDADLLRQWYQYVPMADEFPLQYAVHFPNRGELDEEGLCDAVSLYNGLGCSAMVIHQSQYRQYGAALEAIDPTIRLGVENHRVRRDEVDAWASDSDWLTLDVEHFWKFTMRDAPVVELFENLRSFMEDYCHKLLHVHLPGYVPGFDEHRPQYCSRELVLGVFDLLTEFDYDGFVVSETDSEYQNTEELQMDVLLFDYWRTQHATWRPKRRIAVPVSERERTLI